MSHSTFSTYSILLGVLTFVAVLAFGASLFYRSRLTRMIRSGDPVLTDDMIRQIEDHGRVELDEPLDMEQIQEEEARFWEEQWDEPDEW